MNYIASTNTLVIPAGSLSGTITVTGTDNNVYEVGKSLIVDINSVTNGGEDGTQQKNISITDNESQPSVTLSTAGSSIAENGGTATITATLSNASYQDVTVALGFTGTAISGTDYSVAGTNYTVSSNKLVIPAGSLTGTITVKAKDNLVYTDDKTVMVDISGVTNGTENGTQQAAVNIADDEPAPKVTLSLSDTSLTENDGTVTVTAMLSGKSGLDTTVNLCYTGTADSSDYTASADSITISAGSLSNTATIKGVDDTAYETAETVIVDISSVTGGVEDGTQQVTATITDNDSAPTVTLGANKTSISEDGETVTVTAALSNKTYQDVTV
jgi:hypothetical protein